MLPTREARDHGRRPQATPLRPGHASRVAHAARSMGNSTAAGPTAHARIAPPCHSERNPVTPSAARSLRCPTPHAPNREVGAVREPPYTRLAEPTGRPAPCHTDQLSCKASSSPSTSSATASGPRGTGKPAPRIRTPSTVPGRRAPPVRGFQPLRQPQRSRDRAGADPSAAGAAGLGRLPAAARHDARRGYSRPAAVR